jgi:hypothetical protein
MSLKQIASATVGATAAQITFSSIPQIYTDLWLVVSVRSSNGGNADFTLNLNVNGSPSRTLRGFQTSAGQTTYSKINESGNTIGSVPQSGNSNVFSNTSIRIFDYTTSTNKILFVEDGSNYNAFSNGGLLTLRAQVMTSSTAITSITLSDLSVTNFVQHSTATLYGILKGNGGATVTTT